MMKFPRQRIEGKMDNQATPEVLAMGDINFQGNIIPNTWYQHLRYDSGKPNLNAIIILSDIVYWYRPVEIRDMETGRTVGYKKKFDADKLQRSYGQLADQFGLTKKQSRDAITFLGQKGIITKELRTIRTKNGPMANVLFIGIVPKKIREISKSTAAQVTPSDSQVTPSDSQGIPLLPESQTYTKTTPKTTPETKQASSANADYSRPISLLSEKEVKELKLPLSEWKEYLADEQEERSRKGVIKFLEKKIAVGPLLPDTEDSKMLFEKLGNEAQAKGRNPPGKFPTLACKEKFTAAAGNLNGTLEAAIDSGLAAGITAIPRLVSYISSPKWQQGELKNGQGSVRASQPKTYGQAPGNQSESGSVPLGSGQTPEMRARLEAHFGGG